MDRHNSQTAELILKVTKARTNNPCISSAQIARAYGITRERVRQILSDADLPTRKQYEEQYACMQCGTIVPRSRSYIYRAGLSKQLFCNRRCQIEYHTITVECSNCGKLFTRASHLLLHYPDLPSHQSKQWFCNNACKGNYVGTHYGWPVHKNKNRKHWNRSSDSKRRHVKLQSRKYNYATIYFLIMHGYSPWHVSEMTAISGANGNIYNICKRYNWRYANEQSGKRTQAVS